MEKLIPIVASAGNNNRCIALDIIGFGKSDKPDIDYNFQDHYKYVKEFIDGLRDALFAMGYSMRYSPYEYIARCTMTTESIIEDV